MALRKQYDSDDHNEQSLYYIGLKLIRMHTIPFIPDSIIPLSFFKPDGNGGWDWISSFLVIKGYESLRSIPSLENYENEGYEFIGWSTKENDTTVEYAVGDTPPEPSESYNGSLKLYPVWIAK